MKPRLRCIVVPAVVLVCLAMMSRGDAASPHDVVAVTASNPVLHGLELKTPLDAERRWVNFRGPKFYSAPQEAVQDETPSYLNWYEIRKPEPEAVKRLEVRDAYSGSETFSVMLGPPAFYLIPAQTIQDGPPADIPESLNHFLAFRIANVDSLALPEPTPGKPAFVCLPVQQWHHEEHVPIKSAATVLMVYEVKAKASEGKVTTIDPFGLNGLETGQKTYVYVEGKRIQ
ncbi:hypothetical protein CKO51_24130 [Rhodopirellula sp. SM50]|nr:hypothetical protein [Rhodopirellula sp. SM50]PAY16974.1 hypothetical protein CKO51_24130 [Rhodopirellula sp. SM50]